MGKTMVTSNVTTEIAKMAMDVQAYVKFKMVLRVNYLEMETFVILQDKSTLSQPTHINMRIPI